MMVWWITRIGASKSTKRGKGNGKWSEEEEKHEVDKEGRGTEARCGIQEGKGKERCKVLMYTISFVAMTV